MIIDICVIHGAPPVSVVQGNVSFEVPADHATITSYEGRVYAQGGSTILATQNFGKPSPDEDGRITVSMKGTFATLAAGNYTVKVAATDPTGTTESSASNDFSLPLA